MFLLCGYGSLKLVSECHRQDTTSFINLSTERKLLVGDLFVGYFVLVRVPSFPETQKPSISIKNVEKIAEGRALMSASWASLLSYHTFHTDIILVTNTVMYIASIASVLCTYKSSLLSRL